MVFRFYVFVIFVCFVLRLGVLVNDVFRVYVIRVWGCYVSGSFGMCRGSCGDLGWSYVVVDEMKFGFF